MSETTDGAGDIRAVACAIARGDYPAPGDSEGCKVIGAKKDKNAKGNGPEWYRMVHRDGAWRYVSDERLPSGNFLAGDRRATVYGEVYLGEICIDHDRGSPVTDAYLVVPEPGDEGDDVLLKVEFKKLRGGLIRFSLPDGSEVKLPDPRKK